MCGKHQPISSEVVKHQQRFRCWVHLLGPSIFCWWCHIPASDPGVEPNNQVMCCVFSTKAKIRSLFNNMKINRKTSIKPNALIQTKTGEKSQRWRGRYPFCFGLLIMGWHNRSITFTQIRLVQVVQAPPSQLIQAVSRPTQLWIQLSKDPQLKKQRSHSWVGPAGASPVSY